jgi:hypothetical protein
LCGLEDFNDVYLWAPGVSKSHALGNKRQEVGAGAESNVGEFNQKMDQVLSRLDYDGSQFELLSFMQRPSGQYLVELIVKQKPSSPLNDTQLSVMQLSELKLQEFTSFFLCELNINQFLHQLMQQLKQFAPQTAYSSCE